MGIKEKNNATRKRKFVILIGQDVALFGACGIIVY